MMIVRGAPGIKWRGSSTASSRAGGGGGGSLEGLSTRPAVISESTATATTSAASPSANRGRGGRGGRGRTSLRGPSSAAPATTARVRGE